MTRYRKKPEEVEAWQIGTKPVPEWIKSAIPLRDSDSYGSRLWRIEDIYGNKCDFPEENYLILQGNSVSYANAGFFEANYEVVE